MKLFVLTPEEKRVVTFVMLMILLGVGVKEYRKSRITLPKPEQPSASQGLAGATPVLSPRDRTRGPNRRSRRSHSVGKPSPADSVSPGGDDQESSAAATPPNELPH